jgi:hypothetical protein
MSVVDMHQFYCYNEIKMRGNDQETVDLIKVIKFTDLICGRLKPWTYSQCISDDEGLYNWKSIGSNLLYLSQIS